MMTGLLGLDLENESGLRQSGRSLSPEKSEETLPFANGEIKLVDRFRLQFTVRGEVRGGVANMRVRSPKIDADAVATSIWQRSC